MQSQVTPAWMLKQNTYHFSFTELFAWQIGCSRNKAGFDMQAKAFIHVYKSYTYTEYIINQHSVHLIKYSGLKNI